jgi:hypothetical protein
MTVVPDTAVAANGVVAKGLFTTGAGMLRLAEIMASIGVILSL